MKPIYDIRDQIPRFSANFFTPADPNVRYPKMMINPETGVRYFDPRDAGRPERDRRGVVVNSAEEEAAFWAKHAPKESAAEAPKTVEIAAVEEPLRRGPGRPPMPKNLTA